MKVPSIADPSSPRSSDFITQTLLAAVGLWYFLPRFILTLQLEKTKASVGVDTEGSTPLSHAVELVLFYVVLLVCCYIIVSRWGVSPTSRGVALSLMIAPLAYIVVRDLYADSSPQMTTLVIAVVIFSLWILRPPIASLRSIGYLVGVISIVSIAIAIALPTHGLLRSALTQSYVSEEKEILPWGILIGLTRQGNTLGLFLALGIPCITLIPHRRRRALLLWLTVFALIWTASRGSMFAVALGAVTALAITRTRSEGRAAVAATCCILAFALPVTLPMLTHDAVAFSNRGWIWAASEDAWASSTTFGLGSRWFQRIGSSSEALGPTVFHAHNQFLQILVTGGLVYAFLIAAMLAVAIAAAARLARRSPMPAAYLATLAGCSIFELAITTVENQILIPVSLIPLAIIVFTRDLDYTPNTADAPKATPPAYAVSSGKTSLHQSRYQ